MKKRLMTILLTSLFMIILCFNVQAAPSQHNEIKEENEQIEKLYDYISNMKNQYEILKDINAKDYVKNFMEKGESQISVNKAAKAITTYVFKEIAASLKLIALLIMVAIICALLNNLQKAFSNETLSDIAYFACYALIIIILARSFYLGVNIARDTINKMTDFMMALIPILVMLIASIGGIVEATMLDPIIIGTINISANIFSKFIIPLICMTFVLQFVDNLSEDYKINKLTKLLNQVALWTQGIVMTVFVGVVTIRGITSKAMDQVTVKTAKYAVDNFVPVVGKCLSDAISTVAGYSLLLKNSISSLGLIVIVAMLLVPVIKLLIMAFMYKMAAALIEPISDSRLVNSIGAAGDSLILILSCLICVSVMFFIMIAIMASAGKVFMGT
ncbi:stage III sporulation protein AE [Clostridium botulinum]|uniref:Stage III sporulation protein AE n=4 Tax=Clostridium botulinum TaxID=1491 RepID=A5I315_CLOBH|nr:stage III sporulation protein AE [Clostridium botulinum]EKN41430.1 stage III sporulation protein AE [Clostridium botulinum CFSAN001627]ABS34710.1 stage III sporulation protein AE [Clostridium botulinum A str. ATCC 19397]ABS36332.1 stage III sporulation protein AE [Clostridium botulinum A str. Hall]ACO85741.1 stage III sporulation protein AE [Clostridium botulinum A2 str. Kyoto]APC79231.1 stage III sporulation protein AE [Clostridium botulinum]